MTRELSTITRAQTRDTNSNGLAAVRTVVLLLLLLLVCLPTHADAASFLFCTKSTTQQQQQAGSAAAVSRVAASTNTNQYLLRKPSPYHPLYAQLEDDNDNHNHKDNERNPQRPIRHKTRDTNTNNKNNIVSRFTNPRIDDPALPLSDVLVSQIIAPSLQVAWLALNHAPSPTWLRPIFNPALISIQQGTLLAPALIHGAALSTCWLVGALAAKAYERDALIMATTTTTIVGTTDPQQQLEQQQQQQQQQQQKQKKTLWPVVTRVVQAGAFATGLLIMATQLDLFLEFGGKYIQYGDGPETDFRIQVAAVELSNDVVFEAGTLLMWRIFLALQAERNTTTR